jgi:antitoxin FitA
MKEQSMKIAVELSNEQAALLARTAEGLGVQAEDLAQATLCDALCRDEDEFRSAATYVLEKNKDLYQRLS